MREKLIEILRKTRYEYRRYIGMKDMEKRMAKTEEEFCAIDDSIVGEIPFCADYLIANGVTVATDNNVGDKLTPTEPKWIPVTERFPDLELVDVETYDMDLFPCLVCLNRLDPQKKKVVTKAWYDGDGFMDCDCIKITPLVTHWMPLPEPPKED